jgi:tRNA modification GTPase
MGNGARPAAPRRRESRSGTFAQVNAQPEPIVAIATPPGRGGIGIIRMTGHELDAVAVALLGASLAKRLQPRRAMRAQFLDRTGAAIDAGLALLFPAPNSYTGETVLELHAHGGPVVLRALLARCLEAGRDLGLRIAEPGEFTRRAYMNERIDLAQAEAVADLIDAGSAAAARGAMRSLQGDFSRTVHSLAGELMELRALTEATLDFPDEEIDFLRAADATARLERAIAMLDEVRQRAGLGALLREGVQVVIAGAPNVGKSSLLNALSGEDAAIVTEHPGTTRDHVERRIEIGGIVFNLVDTAGLRETADPIEGMGIARTRAAIAQADLLLELLDDCDPTLRDERMIRELPAGAARLTVHNKIDLSGTLPGAHEGRVFISVRTGAGLADLRAQLLRTAGWTGEAAAETVFLARERHLRALDSAAERLAAAREHASAASAELELFAEDLRLAAEDLGSITGAVSSEDLLGQIFARFCIGK